MSDDDREHLGPMLNPLHLGKLIRESMDAVGWNVTDTAARLACERGTLSRLLNGKAGVSANMALALGTVGWGIASTGCGYTRELRTTGAGAPGASRGGAADDWEFRVNQLHGDLGEWEARHGAPVPVVAKVSRTTPRSQTIGRTRNSKRTTAQGCGAIEPARWNGQARSVRNTIGNVGGRTMHAKCQRIFTAICAATVLVGCSQQELEGMGVGVGGMVEGLTATYSSEFCQNTREHTSLACAHTTPDNCVAMRLYPQCFSRY